jgi:hypothetical protein
MIPIQTLPKLRIDLRKKISLLFLFTLGSFAIIASIVRTILFETDATLFKVIIWSTVEVVICFLVANGPGLRPLFFRGNNFESSGTYSNRHGVGTGRSTHDVYEMAPKDTGVTCVVSAGDQKGAMERWGDHADRRPAVTRTVEVTVHSEDTKQIY